MYLNAENHSRYKATRALAQVICSWRTSNLYISLLDLRPFMQAKKKEKSERDTTRERVNMSVQRHG